MSKIQPLADRVLVKPMAAEEKTIGGIIIPDSAKEKPLRGEVIAVGEGTKDEKNVAFRRRHRIIWQVCRYRTRIRWREVPHHAPKRRVSNFEITDNLNF